MITRHYSTLMIRNLRLIACALMCSLLSVLGTSAFASQTIGYPVIGPTLDRMELREKLASLENQKRQLPPGVHPDPSNSEATSAAITGSGDGLISHQKSPLSSWYSVGPAPIDGKYSGRVAAVAVDPASNTHWLAGTAQGGIWGTTNSGASWLPLTDDQPSLAMGAIAFAPGNTKVVYAGTGEANFSADSYAGQGLLVSHDNGFTWKMINTTFAESSFSSIVVNRGNFTNHLAVATTRGVGGISNHGTNIPPNAPSRGVFISSNGGTSFTQVLNGEATDLKCDPFHFTCQYAGLGEITGSPSNGVYRTTNGWATSQLISGPWYSAATQADFGRVALAISPFNTNVAYVGIAYTRGNTNGDLLGIWQTTNAWAANPDWKQQADVDNGPYLWYSFQLLVDPVDPDTLYYAGGSVLRHVFPADTWTGALTSKTHPDQHAMAWLPYGFDFYTYRMLLGNDGGVWFSSDYPVSGNWIDVNNGICTAQMYRGAVDPNPGSSLSLAGLQDNGTVRCTGASSWPEFFGGDGCDCAIANGGSSINWAFSYQTGLSVNIFRKVTN